MLKCLIVEDDFVFAIDTKIKVEEIGVKVIRIVSSFLEIKDALSNEKIDLILSDVKLKNGEYAFDLFKSMTDLPPIIFFSGVKDPSLYQKSKITNPYIYLSKPFDDITLKSAIEGALRSKIDLYAKEGDIHKKDRNIFVRVSGQMINLIPSEITYIKSEGNYIFIFTSTRKIVIRSSIKTVISKIESEYFIQVHRAYAVNILKINELNIPENHVQINSIQVPVGRKYKKVLLEKLENL